MIRKTKGKASELDTIIGRKLQLFRKLRGLSQQKLGAQADVSFQQIQKYEQGKNRIPASRLYRFSQILNVPLSHFYGDMRQVRDKGSITGFSNKDLMLLKNLNKPINKGLKEFVQKQVR